MAYSNEGNVKRPENPKAARKKTELIERIIAKTLANKKLVGEKRIMTALR